MESYNPSYFMLVPTMACQASCSYCFAKKQSTVMSMDTLRETIDLIDTLSPEERPLKIVFHGGEPLLAGPSFYEKALPLLRQRFGARLRLSMQSNLWELNGPEGDRLLDLFLAYDVKIGTSLDGYRQMCDSQRGEEYYEKTVAAMEKLRRHGIFSGIICTFEGHNAAQAARVFREAEHNYSIHGAVPVPGQEESAEGGISVSVDQMKQILLDSYEAYKSDVSHARISTIDAMASSCVKKKGSLCTFKRCLGQFAAIGPDGEIYSCQRFSGYKSFSLGNVHDRPTSKDILSSEGYRRLKKKEDSMEVSCGDCPHTAYCKGGCLFNAFVKDAQRDPYCEAYRALFDRINVDLALEMAEDMKNRLTGQIAENEPAGPVLCMAGVREHPYEIRMNRNRIKKALEAGKQPGDCRAFLKNMDKELFQTYCMSRLPGIFLNLTYRCPLRCTHCSASAGDIQTEETDPAVIAGFVREAAVLGVKAIEFTGGEPFYYTGFDTLMDLLGEIRRNGTRFILRTSLGFELDRDRLKKACRLFDKIIVSVDGDEAYHDARRGKGSYRSTLENLKAAAAVEERRAGLALWAVLPAKERMGKEGKTVRALAESLSIKDVTFRDLLPLGRSCGAQCPDPDRLPARLPAGFRPRYTCGIDNNLSVEPDGTMYPCYAWKSPDKKIGRIGEASLKSILLEGGLFEYRLHSVDDNKKCSACDVRYLCGGMCKAWVRDREDPDSGDFDCHKYHYYKEMGNKCMQTV